MKTKKVSELKAGDNLGNCVILAPPQYVGNYCGSKNRAYVKVRFSNGEESTRVWGWSTTVKVND